MSQARPADYDGIADKKKQRAEFLARLYELTNGDKFDCRSSDEIGAELGYDEITTEAVTQYLHDEGLIEMMTLDGGVVIAHAGVKEVERRRALPPGGAPTQSQASGVTAGADQRWDCFISHSSEDKEEVARPLAEALTEAGLDVWFDEATLTVGDSLRRSIDNGLARSRFGVVILSQGFFDRDWPQRELDGLTSREIGGQKVILPVWHGLARDDVARYSPTLADRYASNTNKSILGVVKDLLEVLGPTSIPDMAAVDSEQLMIGGRAVSGDAGRLLKLTIEEADVVYPEAPDVDFAMQRLGLDARDYRNAVRELDHLGAVKGHPNANHASGYARAAVTPSGFVAVAEQVIDGLDLRAEICQLLSAFSESEQDLVAAEDVRTATSIPPPRLQILVEFAEEHELIKSSGMPTADRPPYFAWGMLQPAGARVLRADDAIPIIGGGCR